jgi:protein-L-isoaspartate(D-aspartate) O-methyltransferase
VDDGFEELRHRMVEQVRAAARSVDPAVAEALLAVPRHLFMPEVAPETAYTDRAIVTKRDASGRPVSSSSQPTIMAIMLEQLDLRPGQRVLEIGAGTGYNAALLAHLVGPTGHVVSLDIDADLVERARVGLDQAGYTDVVTLCGDGAYGAVGHAPFDRVIATVGVWDLAPAWFEQLVPDGRIVVPLDLRGVHRSVALERIDGRWTSRSLVPCGFMPMRGAAAGPAFTAVLDPASRLSIIVPEPSGTDPRIDLDALIEGWAPGIAAAGSDPAVAGLPQLFDGLSLWLAIHEPRWFVLSENASAPTARLGTAPLRMSGTNLTAGILDGASLAVLTADGPQVEHAERLGLSSVGYGPDGERLAEELLAHVHAWDGSGRPVTADLCLDAYPRQVRIPESPHALVIEKTHTRLVLSWKAASGAARRGEPLSGAE